MAVNSVHQFPTFEGYFAYNGVLLLYSSYFYIQSLLIKEDKMMKKVILFGFGLISFLFATTINIPSDYTTIQEGLNASVDGDTVLVAQGTYSENLILDNEIVLASHAIYDDLGSEWLDNDNINNTIVNGAHNGSCLVSRTAVMFLPLILSRRFLDLPFRMGQERIW